ncbi:MAG: hypothetical protein MI861_14000 [Pirellulales bacterium]|nr:hypothetical protein [Pirellulales bacterium]
MNLHDDLTDARSRHFIRLSLSLREFMGLATVGILAVALIFCLIKLERAEHELDQIRAEIGYLAPTAPGQIAAVRVPTDSPLTYRMRVRVPKSAAYRVTYSSLLPQGSGQPQWYGAVQVPPGEAVITVQIAQDPRDERWKITTLVRSKLGTRRVGTVLPPQHVAVFRGSHQVVSTGIGRDTTTLQNDCSLRLLDERWLVGAGSLLLYGDRPPESDQIGVYAELQPDQGTL